MKKKKSGGGGANWMDTYGDMVTLLLCFFVLLYSMSTISEENWKALVMSFNPDALRTLHETSGNEGPNADPSDATETTGVVMPTVDEEVENPEDISFAMAKQKIEQDIENLYQALTLYVAQEGIQNNISVTKGDGRVFVTFNDAVFFDGNDYDLREESLPILEAVGSMLSDAAESIDEVRILGHTAQASMDRPNYVQQDRLLSAQRAANALAYIQMNTTVDPARMVSEGYGQWQPVADNSTEEGKAQNRRVEMIVSGRDLEAEMGDSLQQFTTSDYTAEPAEDADAPAAEDAGTERAAAEPAADGAAGTEGAVAEPAGGAGTAEDGTGAADSGTPAE